MPEQNLTQAQRDRLDAIYQEHIEIYNRYKALLEAGQAENKRRYEAWTAMSWLGRMTTEPTFLPVPARPEADALRLVQLHNEQAAILGTVQLMLEPSEFDEDSELPPE